MPALEFAAAIMLGGSLLWLLIQPEKPLMGDSELSDSEQREIP
jgi:hypothetical protein